MEQVLTGGNVTSRTADTVREPATDATYDLDRRWQGEPPEPIGAPTRRGFEARIGTRSSAVEGRADQPAAGHRVRPDRLRT